MVMLFKTPVMRLFYILFLVFFLCRCVQTADSRLSVPLSGKSRQDRLSASEHITLANNEKGNARQARLIAAAMQAAHENHGGQVRAILAQTLELTPVQSAQKEILLAKMDVLQGRYPSAERLTSLQEINAFPMPWPVYYHEVLARIYEHAGQKIKAASERISLDSLLTEAKDIQSNRQALWVNLNRFSSLELENQTEKTRNSLEQGWLALALISKNTDNNARAMLKAVDAWQNTFPNHPANHLLADPLSLVAQKLRPAPRQIALLLPLTGTLAGPGNAIKDGFMSAAKKQDTLRIKVYDTYKDNAEKLYAQAIGEGADYVVGPLNKKDAAAVAAVDNPVPTLLLNEVETAKQPNTWQFGLSPALEAAQVAAKASNQGYKRALVIAPEGVWGHEVAAAFSRQWQAEGGQVVDKLVYKNKSDLAFDIREALQVSLSENREKTIKRLLGEKVQTRPGRRNDIDMIFLLAYPGKARQIMPLLKYYYAGDLPVYATSAVYSGSVNSMKDKDLDGIIFCDMPFVFGNSMANKSWPEQFNSYTRLYALGIDSFNLVMQLNQLTLLPALGIGSKNGLLYLTNTNQVVRIPEWGKFKAGQAAILG